MIRGLVLMLACAVALTGCEKSSGSESAGEQSPGSSASAEAAVNLAPAARQVVRDRVAALKSGDRKAFVATLDPANQKFVATQSRYFDNLQKLPLKRYELSVEPGPLPVTIHLRGDAQLVVRVSMQLDGYDKAPVVQDELFTFAQGADDALTLTDNRDLKFDAMNNWLPSPWDLTDITVKNSDEVLGIFDDKTRDDADAAMADVSGALDDVNRVVPPWQGKVVAYDISDVSAMDRMSAMEVDNTAGVAFPVLGGKDGEKVIAMRFAINPNVVVDAESRKLTFRHELTHVAVVKADRGNPVWLREGTAQYVAYQTYAGPSLDAWLAHIGTMYDDVKDLEVGIKFYEVDPDGNYQMSLLVCDWIAVHRGVTGLWELKQAMGKAKIVSETDQDRVLRRELGLDSTGLLREARAWAATL